MKKKLSTVGTVLLGVLMIVGALAFNIMVPPHLSGAFKLPLNVIAALFIAAGAIFAVTPLAQIKASR